MGRYAKGEERRAAILDAALDLIGRNGFRNSTLADIADAVGLTKAGVLHYFGSKDELYAEVLRLRDERGTPHEGLSLDGFVAVMRDNAEVGGLVHLFTAMAAAAVEPDHDAHDFFAERYERIREQLAAAVRAEAAAGRLPDDLDADRFARVLIALADGLQVQWLLDPTIDMAGDVAAVVDLVRAAGGTGRGSA